MPVFHHKPNEQGVDTLLFLIILNYQIYWNQLTTREDRMARRNENTGSCSTADKACGCCSVESVVSIDERGQMVLPKEIRDEAGIRAGDKLALLSWEKEGKVCCISLIKADDLSGVAKGLLGPMMKEIAREA